MSFAGPAVIAATGPSFSSEQAKLIEAARARGVVRVIAVNDNWRLLPNADVLYACDGVWWDKHIGAAGEQFAGQLWTQDCVAAEKYQLCFVPCETGKAVTGLGGMGRKTFVIRSGGNSGYQAMNLAYHFGATKLILAGFDSQRTDKKAHWFGEHPPGLSRTHPYRSWLAHFEVLALDLAEEGIEVLNCSTETAIKSFRRADLRETLEAL